MVSPSKPQHSRVASHTRTKCKIIKGSKPLVNFRFYLDIEQHNVSNKIELKIKELGGSIEFFLAKEVTHFVTDKPFEQRDQNCPSPLLLTPVSHQQLPPKTPGAPQTPYTPLFCDLDDAISPNAAISNESKATNSKRQSRADAMLQRARNQSFDSSSKVPSLSHSPVLLAKSWGTPIWTPEYTLKFLEKIKFALKVDYDSKSTNPHSHRSARGANAKRLKGEYIKIETFQRNYRPYYKELKAWPRLNLSGAPGQCPFVLTDKYNAATPVPAAEKPTKLPDEDSKPKADVKDAADTMTRKSRSKHLQPTKNDIKLSSEKQCGYCEICRTEYDILSTHLQSKDHVNFVKNADNFLALDTLITNSASVNSFLNVNKPDKADIDSGLFGKRTSSKKVAKLFRSNDDKPDLQINAAEFVKLNGNHPVSSMCTRRSNTRRADPVPESKSPAKRSPVKPVPMEVNDDEDDDEDDDDDDEEDCNEVHEAIADNEDTVPLIKLRTRRESAKRINYAEPKEDEDNSNDSKMQQIRIRGIRWRPPSTDSPTALAQHQPVVYKVVDPECGVRSARSNRSGAHSRTEPSAAESNNKTSTSGIKVRICRVRESELSLLTNEADNFMFPRISSDQPTDEDRQSTPEPTDLSAEIFSSEVDSSKPVATTSKARVRNTSESSGRDLDTTNKRTRRKQLEAFLNDNSDYYKFDNPDSRLRFQEAPFQPSLIRFDSCDIAGAGGGGVGVGASYSTRSTMIATQLSMPKASTIAGATATETEDGKGAANTFDNGKLLKSDIVKRHKFAFERIPSTEPWFEAFQRQDECRERIFEYWGSTAYRKLPFELGPLPPHAPDCCPVAKATQKPKHNKAKNKKIQPPTEVAADGRENHHHHTHHHHHHHHHPQQPNDPPPELVLVPCKQRKITTPTLPMTGRLIDDPIIAKRLQDEAAMQKRLMKIQKQLELQPVIQPSAKCDVKRSSSVYFTSSLSSRGDARSVLTIKSETIEKKMHRRNLMKDFAPPSPQQSPTIDGDRRGSQLFDIYGQPRKSPREHASTLAILSCIVQQQRKREKELNGGISPEKMAGPSGPAEQTDSEDYDDDMTEAEPPPANDPLQRIHIKQECDSDNDLADRFHSPAEPFAGSSSSTTRAASAAAGNNSNILVRPPSATKSRCSSTKDDMKGFPKMPVIDYQNPHKICRQIDEMLLEPLPLVSDDSLGCRVFDGPGDDIDLTDIPVDGNSTCDDLILISTPKDLLEIVTSVAPGPLSYRSYVNLRKPTGLSSFVNRKRRNNKTGWPSVPKRRVIATPIKKELDDDEDSCSVSNTEVEDNVGTSPAAIAPPADDYFVNARPNDCLQDDSRHSFVFTSSSEKAEHSDIFTVSSDSVDTAEMAAAARIRSPQLPFSSKVINGTATSATSAYESTSTDFTLAHMLKTEIGVSVGENDADDDDDDDDMITDDEDDDDSAASQKDVLPAVVHLPTATVTSASAFHVLQPIVRVRKINHHDLQRNRVSRNYTGSDGASTTSPSSVLTPKKQSVPAAPASPKTQFSPPKLRKPRGRWYRER